MKTGSVINKQYYFFKELCHICGIKPHILRYYIDKKMIPSGVSRRSKMKRWTESQKDEIVDFFRSRNIGKKVKIELNEFYYNCADGCCTNYGTTTKVNGVEMDYLNQDTGTILKMVLEHLGYEVEIIETYSD